MKELITDITKLEVAEPLEFISATGIDRTEGDEIVKELKEVMEANPDIIALTAPQIGIAKRVFCIRFNDTIKTFINPIITKKFGGKLTIETCNVLPGKEILLTCPEEITVVYYTDDFKYEDNKLIGPAAAIFDQQIRLLDGVLPSDIGLVSDVTEDGSLNDLTAEEFEEIKEIYQQFIKIKTKQATQVISQDDELNKQYRQLKFSEDVINGRTLVVDSEAETSQKMALNKAAKTVKIQEKNAYAKSNFKVGVNKALNKKKGKK